MADPTGLIERSVLSGNGRAKNGTIMKIFINRYALLTLVHRRLS
jgi:hypothetical protein